MPTRASCWPTVAASSSRRARRPPSPSALHRPVLATRDAGRAGIGRGLRAQPRDDLVGGRRDVPDGCSRGSRCDGAGQACQHRVEPRSRRSMPDPAPLIPVSRQPPRGAVRRRRDHAARHRVRGRIRAHGYCTDDVARALQVDLLHAAELGWAAVRRAWPRCPSLPRRGLRPGDGTVPELPRRRRDLARRASGSEDCPRTGVATPSASWSAAHRPDAGLRAEALTLFERALPRGGWP